jgi:hypothetical protein
MIRQSSGRIPPALPPGTRRPLGRLKDEVLQFYAHFDKIFCYRNEMEDNLTVRRQPEIPAGFFQKHKGRGDCGGFFKAHSAR